MDQFPKFLGRNINFQQMNNKGFIAFSILIFIAALAVGVVGYFGFVDKKSTNQKIACTMEAKLCPDGSAVGRTGPNCEFAECANGIDYTSASADLIKVESPVPGEAVGKNFSVEGVARGTWFFEASFPVVVLGKDGEVLVETYATANGEWMTENFV